jgi:L-lactate dehydrogenase complex protein LldG
VSGAGATSARERILARIRAEQGKPPQASAEEEAVLGHLGVHPRGPVPRVPADPVAAFIERVRLLASTCEEAAQPANIPEAVVRYLKAQGIPLRAVCWPEFAELDWAGAGIEVEARAVRADDRVGITGAFCAIAETGTLVMRSGAGTPGTLSLLPDTHVALVSRERVVGTMEDAWALVRSAGPLPRSVTFISGPSRTADIEQTVTLGAHGPYRVHVVLVGG